MSRKRNINKRFREKQLKHCRHCKTSEVMKFVVEMPRIDKILMTQLFYCRSLKNDPKHGLLGFKLFTHMHYLCLWLHMKAFVSNALDYWDIWRFHFVVEFSISCSLPSSAKEHGHCCRFSFVKARFAMMSIWINQFSPLKKSLQFKHSFPLICNRAEGEKFKNKKKLYFPSRYHFETKVDQGLSLTLKMEFQPVLGISLAPYLPCM